MDSLDDPGDEARLEITTDDLDEEEEESMAPPDDEALDTQDDITGIHPDSIHGILFHGQVN